MKKRFAAYLNRVMVERGMNTGDLAEGTGQHRVTVSRHVNGHNLPYLSIRKLYAALLDLPIAEFERAWRMESLPGEADKLSEAIAAIQRKDIEAAGRILDLLRAKGK